MSEIKHFIDSEIGSIKNSAITKTWKQQNFRLKPVLYENSVMKDFRAFFVFTFKKEQYLKSSVDAFYLAICKCFFFPFILLLF